MAIEDIPENARLSKIFKNTFGAVSEVGLRSSYKHEPCTAHNSATLRQSIKDLGTNPLCLGNVDQRQPIWPEPCPGQPPWRQPC